MTSNDDHSFGVAEFRTAAAAALEQLCDYVDHSAAGRGPAVDCRPMAEVCQQLELQRWIQEGGMTTETFAVFLTKYLRLSTRLHHPGYLAHQVAAPDGPAALADLIHGVINNPMAIYEMGPSASSVEHIVVNWMLHKVGWTPEPMPGESSDEHGAGVLTHGGSLANLTALLAARAAAAPEAWQQGTPRDLVVLVAPSSHYSVARAASLLGLGARAVLPLQVDDRDVIVADGVAAALEKVRKDGKRCMAVVANACATATGLYDPVAAIAEHCQSAGVWLHIDAAHGASALLSTRERERLRGVEHADSLVWDAHKMLRTSALCAAVLVRRAGTLPAAFQQEASYLFHGDGGGGIDFIERTVECTKAALGMKLFLNLAWRGEASLADYVEGRYDATRRFYRRIQNRPGFECPFAPESNILCFRFGDDDALQGEIRKRLVREGSFYLSSAVVAGKRYLRLAVMAPSTSEETIDALLDAIEALAEALGSVANSTPTGSAIGPDSPGHLGG